MLIQHEFRAKIFPYIEKNTKGIYTICQQTYTNCHPINNFASEHIYVGLCLLQKRFKHQNKYIICDDSSWSFLMSNVYSKK